MESAHAEKRVTLAQRVLAQLLVAAMAVGGLVLWLGIPLGWLWVASQMTSGTQPTFGPYMLVAVGIPISMIAFARLLRALDHLHSRLLGKRAVRVQMAWLKSMRGERHSERPTTALDVIMVGTALAAVVAMGVWFLTAAGNPLPQ